MLSNLIDKAKTEDLLFLSAIIINIMNKTHRLKPECVILPELFTTLGLENTINIIKYFGGETIQIPSHEEMYQAFLVIICYYKKKIEGKSWDEIKKEIHLVDITPHTLGKIIEAIDRNIIENLQELKESGIKEYLEKYKDLFSQQSKEKPTGKEVSHGSTKQ